jgi:hypothetical protein
MIGASYENVIVRVPTTALTVITLEILTPTFAGEEHSTFVDVCHELVPQFKSPRIPVGVRSVPYPKLVPTSVTLLPPDVAEFIQPMEEPVASLSTGASKEKVF